jgi:hypothetical protein
MRIVLVHGIENQGRSEAIIREDWLEALARVLSASDMAALRRSEIVAPYYGDILYAATQRESAAGPEPVAQSAADAPAEEADFYREALEDFAPAAGVTETQIRAQAGIEEPTELGFPHDRRLLALLRAIEAVSPWQGRLILRFLPQAFVYLNRAHVKSRWMTSSCRLSPTAPLWWGIRWARS